MPFEHVKPNPDPDAVIADLLDHATEVTGVTASEILGPRRIRRIVQVRQELMLQAQEAGLCIAEIGRQLNRDHTSVLAAIRRAEQRRVEIPIVEDPR